MDTQNKTEVNDTIMPQENLTEEQSMDHSIQRAEEGFVTEFKVEKESLEFTHKIRSSIFRSKNIFFLLGTLPTLYSIYRMFYTPELKIAACSTDLSKLFLYGVSEYNITLSQCIQCNNQSDLIGMGVFLENRKQYRTMDYFHFRFSPISVFIFFILFSFSIYGLGVWYMGRIIRAQKYRVRMLTGGVSVPIYPSLTFGISIYFIFVLSRVAYYVAFDRLIGQSYIKIGCEDYYAGSGYNDIYIRFVQYSANALQQLLQSSAFFFSFLLAIYASSSMTRFLKERDFKEFIYAGVRVRFQSLAPVKLIIRFYKRFKGKDHLIKILGMLDFLKREGYLMPYRAYDKTRISKIDVYLNQSCFFIFVMIFNLFWVTIFALIGVLFVLMEGADYTPIQEICANLITVVNIINYITFNFGVVRKSLRALKIYIAFQVCNTIIFLAYFLEDKAIGTNLMVLLASYSTPPIFSIILLFGCGFKKYSFMALISEREKALNEQRQTNKIKYSRLSYQIDMDVELVGGNSSRTSSEVELENIIASNNEGEIN